MKVRRYAVTRLMRAATELEILARQEPSGAPANREAILAACEKVRLAREELERIIVARVLR